MPRSLLIFSGEAYEQCLHGIDAVRLHLTTMLKLSSILWPAVMRNFTWNPVAQRGW